MADFKRREPLPEKFTSEHSIMYKTPSGRWFTHTGTRLGLHNLLREELANTEFRSTSTPKFSFLAPEELKQLEDYGVKPKKRRQAA